MMRTPLLQLVGALVLLGITVAGYGVWYMKVDAEGGAVGNIESQITAKTQDTTRAAVAKSELESLTADENSVEQYFVSTNDVVPFLESIQSLGKFLGAKVTVVSVSALPGTPFGQLNLALKITGSFNAVARTIGAIEYGPYDTTITALTLDADTNPNQIATSTPPSWTATANFSVGTQPTPAATSHMAAPVQQPVVAPAAADATIPPAPTAVATPPPTQAATPTASLPTIVATDTPTSTPSVVH